MLLLISGCLVVAGVLWSVLYAHYNVAQTLRTILGMVVFQFFGVGLVVSTALWSVSTARDAACPCGGRRD